MKMELNRQEETVCLLAAIKFALDGGNRPDDGTRYNTEINFYSYIAEWAETIGSEWVVAKYLGVSYDPHEPKFKVKADVGNGIEVKWTKYVAGQLIVHEYDRTTDIAVLVTGKSPHYFIAGWIPVAIAKKPRYRHSKQPNWWVTQINLQPIENLRKSTYGQTAI